MMPQQEADAHSLREARDRDASEGEHKTRIQIPTQPLTSCARLSTCFSTFSHLRNRMMTAARPRCWGQGHTREAQETGHNDGNGSYDYCSR